MIRSADSQSAWVYMKHAVHVPDLSVSRGGIFPKDLRQSILVEIAYIYYVPGGRKGLQTFGA